MVSKYNGIQDLNVKKANYLLSFEEKMTKSAQLCVSFLISCLPHSEVKEGFPALTFSFRDLKNIVNADGKRRITSVDDLWNINAELMSVPLWYENDRKKGAVAWMSNIEADKETKQFTYFFHPKLERHLLNLKSQYTLYSYYYRVCLTTNGMKFYEIMKMYEKHQDVILDIETEIKKPLGLYNKYSAYYDLRRRVLDPICEELTKFTDLKVSYTPAEKEGRRVISLQFHIEANQPTHVPLPLREVLERQKQKHIDTQLKIDDLLNSTLYKQEYPGIYETLGSWGAKNEIITSTIGNYGIERVEYIKSYVEFELKRNDIEDPLALFLQGVRSDWMQPSKKKREMQVSDN